VFEHCILSKFKVFLSAADNHFNSKKGIRCNFAISCLQGIVDNFVKGGSTVNICAIDLPQVFNKVNHLALYCKTNEKINAFKTLDSIRKLAVVLFFSSVKWFSSWSAVFRVVFGVRHGSVLAPFLFDVYLDDLVRSCSTTNASFIIQYADDILLIAPSVCELEKLLRRCKEELYSVDMSINFKKCSCVRFGPRCNIACENIVSSTGVAI